MAGRPITANVPCPHCGYAYSKQHHSHIMPDGYRRKRHCLNDACGASFITFEVYAADLVMLRALRKYAEELKTGKPFYKRKKNGPRSISKDVGAGKASS